jgi:hypothetical protein
MKLEKLLIILMIFLISGNLPEKSFRQTIATEAYVEAYQGEETQRGRASLVRIDAKQQEIQDIRDIKEPVKPNLQFPFVIIALTLTLLGFTGIHFIIDTIKRRSALPRSAFEIARGNIEDLKRKCLSPREYYREMSTIVRYYVENEFAIKATAMTTEEFLNEVGNTHRLSVGQIELLRDFLIQCDLVNYAGYEPSQEEVDRSISSAEEIIESANEKPRL